MSPDDERAECLIHSVIGAFYEVYNTLRYGLFEHLYATALAHELRARGHCVGREVDVTVTYKGLVLGSQRLDMVVDDTLVVELKATHDLSKAAARQVYTYLCCTRLEHGLLLHFGPDARFYRFRRRRDESTLFRWSDIKAI